MNNTKDWLQVLSAFKTLNKETIFDEWSKGSPKYDKYKNHKIWQDITCKFDINYIIILLNKAGNNFKLIENIRSFTL